MYQNKNISISIVIRSYNEEKYIAKLLSRLNDQTEKNIEVIVVDSGSIDKTIEIAQRYDAKVIKIEKDQFSFGRSLNLGCENAKGDIIIISSAHIYPKDKYWIKNMIAPFQDKKVAVVYGKQRGNGNTKYSEKQIFYKWYSDETIMNQTYPFCNNANAAVRKSIWNKIPYNESLTALEDIDFAKKAMEHCFRVAYVAEAEVEHAHNETAKNIFNRYRREAIGMKQIFPQESFSLFDFVRLFIANAFNDIYHAAKEKVLFENIKDIIIFRLMQFGGTYRGFNMRGPVNMKLREKIFYPNGRKKKV